MPKPFPKVKMTEAIPEEDWPRMRYYLSLISLHSKYAEKPNYGELFNVIREVNAGVRRVRSDGTPQSTQNRIIGLRKQGYTYKQIGEMVGVSQRTAHFYGRYVDAPGIYASKQAGQ